jgi:hypothetical protein
LFSLAQFVLRLSTVLNVGISLQSDLLSGLEPGGRPQRSPLD